MARRSFDLLFLNATVIDGTGAANFTADVGIKDGRIEAVGQMAQAEAERKIDVAGKALCPGFIDVHVHSELGVLTGEITEARVRQGITTDVLSPDGFSLGPCNTKRRREYYDYLSPFHYPKVALPEWDTYAEYLALFDGQAAINVLPQVPFNAIRLEVVGWEPREATKEEVEQMQSLARDGMECGATGVQFGLDYYPAANASTAELVAVARTVAGFGGLVSAHIRNYGRSPKEAIEEMLAVARGAGAPIHFSHFFDIERIEAIRDAGVDITFDAYPYMAGCTSLLSCLPEQLQVGSQAEITARLSDATGGRSWRKELNEFLHGSRFSMEEDIFASVGGAPDSNLLGMSLAQAIEQSGKEPANFVADLLVQERLAVLMIFAWNNEERYRAGLTHPLHMLCSDGIFRVGRPHPRGWGSFPKFIREVVREKKWLSLPEAVRMMTSFPAARYKLKDRGLIREGMAADIVVFDPEKITDRATFDDGSRLAEGVDYVAVNGKLVIDNGRMTSELPGRVLRR